MNSRGVGDGATPWLRTVIEIVKIAVWTVLGVVGVAIWLGLANTALEDPSNRMLVPVAVLGGLSGPAILIRSLSSPDKPTCGCRSGRVRLASRRFGLWGLLSAMLVIGLAALAP